MAVTPLAAFVAVIVNPLFPVYVHDIAAVPLERVGSSWDSSRSARRSRRASTAGSRMSSAPVPAIVGAGAVLTLAHR
jgi:hypothetical protein